MPAWMCVTPTAPSYQLVMFADGEHLQDIELTRDEFLKVKLYIGKICGFALQAEQPEYVNPCFRLVGGELHGKIAVWDDRPAGVTNSMVESPRL